MAAFILMAGSFPAQARLGEDLKALEERFGSPIEDKQVSELDLRQLSFRNHDLMVGVTLIDNRSASEQYVRSTFKRDSEGKLILIPIPRALAGAILEANRNGSTWSKISQPGATEEKYLRGDEEAIAYYKIQQDHIVEVRLSTSEFNRHLTRIAKEKK
jgi:hypothetical protein